MLDTEKYAICNRVVRALSQGAYKRFVPGNVSDATLDDAASLMASIKKQLAFIGLTVGDVTHNDLIVRVRLAMQDKDAEPVAALCPSCGCYHGFEGCAPDEPEEDSAPDGIYPFDEAYEYAPQDWDAASAYIEAIGLNPREDVNYVGRLAQLLHRTRVPSGDGTDTPKRDISHVDEPICAGCGRPKRLCEWGNRKNPEA